MSNSSENIADFDEDLKFTLLSFAQNMNEAYIFDEFLCESQTKVDSLTLIFAKIVQEYLYSDELPRSALQSFQDGLDEQVKHMYTVLYPSEFELRQILENRYDVYISSLVRSFLNDDEFRENIQYSSDDLISRLISLELEMYDDFDYSESLILNLLTSDANFDHMNYVDLIIESNNWKIYEDYIMFLFDLYSSDEVNLDILTCKINESDNDELKEYIELMF